MFYGITNLVNTKNYGSCVLAIGRYSTLCKAVFSVPCVLKKCGSFENLVFGRRWKYICTNIHKQQFKYAVPVLKNLRACVARVYMPNDIDGVLALVPTWPGTSTHSSVPVCCLSMRALQPLCPITQPMMDVGR